MNEFKLALSTNEAKYCLLYRPIIAVSIYLLRCVKTQKFDDKEIESKIVKLIDQTRQPVSTDFVAHNLEIGWGTARGILLNMALKGKIKALKTTKSFVFMLPEDNKPDVGGI
jgi:hypothetical protein